MRCLLALVLALQALPAAAQLYRWTDSAGRVHYTDTPPPPGAKGSSVRQKASSAPGSEPPEPFAVQQARASFPVKLYSAAGCQPCDAARELLNRRGVPFSEVSVTADPDGLEELRKTTGVGGVPALLVGRAAQTGFEAAIYHRMLDEAGYPKTGILPARSQAAPNAAAPEGREEAPETPAPPGPYAPSRRG